MKKIIEEKKLKKEKIEKKQDISISTDFSEEFITKKNTTKILYQKSKKIKEEDLILKKKNFQSANFEFFDFENSDKKLFTKILGFFKKDTKKKKNFQNFQNFQNNENSSFLIRGDSMLENTNYFFDEIIGIEHPLQKNIKNNNDKINSYKKPFGFFEIDFTLSKRFSNENYTFNQKCKKFKFN